MANGNGDGDAGAPRDRNYYLSQAYINAFGTYDEPDWNPDNGYAANRDRIIKVYEYYKAVYLKGPSTLLWAGLGRMAGAAVVNGLDLVVQGGETFLTKTMSQIVKSIFHDIAWQHEAFLDDQQNAIAQAAALDGTSPARNKYADAWANIASGDSDKVALGNQQLLENEQFNVIQPQYDAIAASSEASIFSHTRAFAGKIHPYHRDFIVEFPTSDVTVAADRWA